VLGGVMFGWSEYESLSSAPDAEKYNEAYGNYVKYYLAGMHDASKRAGRRLLHALDIHWYPEARGTKRITDDDASAKTIAARLQAPRSLWDDSYIERSWITQQTGKPIRLLRWFQEMITERFPGTNLTMTEYNFGGTKHVSGGLAQIDVLGVFGREGVFMANYWGNAAGVGDLPPYIAAAFRMYRNYDGKGGAFGDVAVVANSPNQDLLSVFAATDAKNTKRLTIIVINKHQQNIYDGAFDIGVAGGQTTAQTFVLDSDGTDIAQGPDVPIASGKFHFALQPLSATLFVCE
jgi:mannan endo-1,4-beta-mannosidase